MDEITTKVEKTLTEDAKDEHTKSLLVLVS